MRGAGEDTQHPGYDGGYHDGGTAANQGVHRTRTRARHGPTEQASSRPQMRRVRATSA